MIEKFLESWYHKPAGLVCLVLVMGSDLHSDQSLNTSQIDLHSVWSLNSSWEHKLNDECAALTDGEETWGEANPEKLTFVMSLFTLCTADLSV